MSSWLEKEMARMYSERHELERQHARRRRRVYVGTFAVASVVWLTVLAPEVVVVFAATIALVLGTWLGLRFRAYHAELRTQEEANERDRIVRERCRRDAAVVQLEHDTEVKPLGEDPDHCDDCRREVRRREQRFIHDLATTVGDKCGCDVCHGEVLKAECYHPESYRTPAYDVLNEDNVLVHVDAFCRNCGYAVDDV